jgi:hypothetical protein
MAHKHDQTKKKSLYICWQFRPKKKKKKKRGWMRLATQINSTQKTKAQQSGCPILVHGRRFGQLDDISISI